MNSILSTILKAAAMAALVAILDAMSTEKHQNPDRKQQEDLWR